MAASRRQQAAEAFLDARADATGEECGHARHADPHDAVQGRMAELCGRVAHLRAHLQLAPESP